MKIATIIVAGGSGVRMGAEIPKQFLLLHGQPILMRTIRAFYDALGAATSIIVALPSSHIPMWEAFVETYHFDVPHGVVCGGATRFHSVKAALEFVSEDTSVVMVHDGVRPLVSKEVINRVVEDVVKHDAVIPVVAMAESIRRKEEGFTKAVDRADFVVVQTPQAFSCGLIKRAYDREWESRFTDDASLVESLGEVVHTVEGDVDNLKITTMIDLFAASKWMEERENKNI